MPTYEFTCHACNKPFEITESVATYDAARVKCPTCGGQRVERRWSSVSTITSKKS